MRKFLDKIPSLLSSPVAIIIYIMLFVYLVVFGFLGLIPSLKFLQPSDDIQLILGNYTNVLSALGASIAAGAATSAHQHIKKTNQHHQELIERIKSLEEKIDKLK